MRAVLILALALISLSQAGTCHSGPSFDDLCQNHFFSIEELTRTFLFQSRELGCFSVFSSFYTFISPTAMTLVGNFTGAANKTLELRSEDCRYHFVFRFQLFAGGDILEAISLPDKPSCEKKSYCEVSSSQLNSTVVNRAQEFGDDVEFVIGRKFNGDLVTFNLAFFPANNDNFDYSIFTSINPVTGLPATLLTSYFTRISC